MPHGKGEKKKKYVYVMRDIASLSPPLAPCTYRNRAFQTPCTYSMMITAISRPFMQNHPGRAKEGKRPRVLGQQPSWEPQGKSEPTAPAAQEEHILHVEPTCLDDG